MDVHIQRAGYESGEAVIEEIEFEVHPGEIVGMIGSNGAGKSTTIACLTGTIPWMRGTVDSGSYAYIPEQPIYYDYLTLAEHIALVTELTEIETSTRTNRLLQLFRLESVQHDYIASFSKGMKQKAMILLALIQEAEFLLVDEPFVGLDATTTIQLLRLLEEERRQGTGVLLVTHVLDTADRLCDRFVWIDNGRMLASGTKQEIRTSLQTAGESLFDMMEDVAMR
ncbi:ATP-binding cassette domain-containing protein [Exiguobacterium aurantiacum]|uniref:ABC-type transporter ATP-binding protein EcsA n=1 Tax=Exiguobacterium aurantiacum TaxID=33987 RepID=A0A377FYV7_9BACL|nr:ABC transporter ATP-binding protein [Exiguobacterium aurantiacum]STO09493.1 ABC-type transporter ATP-binding protein EcsA [Exiguobacterium aurantiacum]